MNIRKLTFGKYKGQPILFIISTHIGYIMWCLENLQWFKLNEVEQKLYDWEAIAIKKYNFPMTFPIDIMLKHVKDRKALVNLCTPLQLVGRYDLAIPKDTDISNLLQKAGVIIKPTEFSKFYGEALPALNHSATKEIDRMSDEEIQEMNDIGIKLPLL